MQRKVHQIQSNIKNAADEEKKYNHNTRQNMPLQPGQGMPPMPGMPMEMMQRGGMPGGMPMPHPTMGMQRMPPPPMGSQPMGGISQPMGGISQPMGGISQPPMDMKIKIGKFIQDK